MHYGLKRKKARFEAIGAISQMEHSNIENDQIIDDVDQILTVAKGQVDRMP